MILLERFGLFLFVLRIFTVYSACPYEWENGGKCYFFSTTQKTFADAQSECSTLNGYLAEPLTDTEITYIKDTTRGFGTSESYWLGGTDVDVEGQWRWVTKNQPFSAVDWALNQPDNAANSQHCLVLYNPQTYFWNDDYCTTPNRYVCELRVDCPVGFFKCQDQTCISNWLVCNGEKECTSNGEDEDNCGDINVALRKETKQTSNFGSPPSLSSYAVDGIPHVHRVNGAWACAHTWHGPPEKWWAVDLGAVYDVKRINVYNRNDSPQYYYLFNNINADVIMPTECNECDCDKWQTYQQGVTTNCLYYPGVPGPLVIGSNCPEGTRGRFVKVHKTNDPTELIFCEVEVFGSLIEEIGKNHDIGDSCNLAMSSTECVDEHAICSTEHTGNKCRCTHCYYDDDLDDANIGGNCTLKKQIGEDCSGNDVECLDVNAVCASGGKCRCRAGFVDSDSDNNIGGYCIMNGPPDNKGMEFLIAFMQNANNSQNPEVSITTSKTSDVTVFVIAESANETFSITAGLEKTIRLNANLQLKGTEYNKKGVLIRSSDEITVFAFNRGAGSVDGYLALPTDVTGATYYAVNYHSNNTTSQLGVAGIEDGTIVTVTLASCDKCGSISYDTKTYNKGDSFTIDLDRFDVLQLQSSGDLTGTLVSSNRKISVFSGTKDVNMGVQVPPVSTWGKSFAIISTPSASSDDSVKIVSSQTSTTVSFSCGVGPIAILLLNAGDFFQIRIPGIYCIITAGKPILVLQIVRGVDIFSQSVFIVPPTEQYDNDYTFTTPSTTHNFYNHYFVFVVKATELSGLRFDGQPLPDNTEYQTMSDFVRGYVSVSQGQHSAHHVSPIALFYGVVYGVSTNTSYGVSVGLRLAPINTVCVPSSTRDGDGIDNDCDGRIDEELCSIENLKKDDDNDGRTDEDCSEQPVILNPCRTGWWHFEGICYLFSKDTMDWASAQIFCESQFGTLAESNTNSKINYLTAVATYLNSGQMYWIGGSDIKTEGAWLWTLSGPMISGSQDWSFGQPRHDTGDEDCAAMDNTKAFKWSNFDCSEKHSFICQAVDIVMGSMELLCFMEEIKKLGRHYPIYVFHEHLPVPEVKVYQNNGEFELKCEVNTTYMNFTYYVVTWTWDEDKAMTIFNTSEHMESMTLPVSLVQKIGLPISCTIEGRHADNVTYLTFTSTHFYPTIQTVSTVTMEKGGHGEIGYHLTMPFTCAGCRVSLRVADIHASPGDICGGDISLLNVDSCTPVIPNDDSWNDTKILKIKHRPNQQFGIRQSVYKIKLQGMVTVGGNTYMTNISDVEVVVVKTTEEWSRHKCYAYCDPHMKTFDGLYYEHQQRGTYYLYRNSALTSGMEVQVKLSSCNYNYAWCVCGMAVRAGSDVFIVNMCDGYVHIDFESCEYDAVLHVAKTPDNRNYLIKTPTGTEIRARLVIMQGGNFLDISISASVDDVGNTEGLCGTMTENCGDDFTKPDGTVTRNDTLCYNSYYWLFDKEFSNSWEVPPTSDLFNPDRTIQFPMWKYPEQLCTCKRNETNLIESCTNIHPSVHCVDPGYESIDSSECRKKPPPGGSIVIVTNRTQPFENITEPDIPESEILNMTEPEARNHCQTTMEKSRSYNACSSLEAIDVTKFVDICTMDVVLTKSSLWLENAVELLRSDCTTEMEKNSTLNNSTDPDELCPGFPDMCSDRGNCSKGTCECEDGFTGHDCSTDKDNPPNTTIIIKELCDKNKMACNCVSVFGRTFHSSVLYCQFQAYFFTTETVIDGQIMTVSGTAVSMFEVKCCFPPVLFDGCRSLPSVTGMGTIVEVGYSNNTFSTSGFRSVVFDSSCQVYNAQTTSFYIMEGRCYIKCQCYSDGDVSPHDTSQVCSSNITKYEWTNVTSTTTTVTTTSTTAEPTTTSTTTEQTTTSTTTELTTTTAHTTSKTTAQSTTVNPPNNNSCNCKSTEQAIIISVTTSAGVIVCIAMFVCCFVLISTRHNRKRSNLIRNYHDIQEKSSFHKYKSSKDDESYFKDERVKTCSASMCCGCWGHEKKKYRNVHVQSGDSGFHRDQSIGSAHLKHNGNFTSEFGGRLNHSYVGSTNGNYSNHHKAFGNRIWTENSHGKDERKHLYRHEYSNRENIERRHNITGVTDSFGQNHDNSFIIYQGQQEPSPTSLHTKREVIYSVDGQNFHKGVISQKFTDEVQHSNRELNRVHDTKITTINLQDPYRNSVETSPIVDREEGMWYSVEACVPETSAMHGGNGNQTIIQDENNDQSYINNGSQIRQISEAHHSLKHKQNSLVQTREMNSQSNEERENIKQKRWIAERSSSLKSDDTSTENNTDNDSDDDSRTSYASERKFYHGHPSSRPLVPYYGGWFVQDTGYWDKTSQILTSTNDKSKTDIDKDIISMSKYRNGRYRSNGQSRSSRRDLKEEKGSHSNNSFTHEMGFRSKSLSPFRRKNSRHNFTKGGPRHERNSMSRYDWNAWIEMGHLPAPFWGESADDTWIRDSYHGNGYYDDSQTNNRRAYHHVYSFDGRHPYRRLPYRDPTLAGTSHGYITGYSPYRYSLR